MSRTSLAVTIIRGHMRGLSLPSVVSGDFRASSLSVCSSVTVFTKRRLFAANFVNDIQICEEIPTSQLSVCNNIFG